MTHPVTSPRQSAPKRDAEGVAEVHVIHLARATERRALMEAELARVGVAVASWAAVDARAPENAQRVAALPDHGPWGDMHPHAKGCLLSHLDALQRFMDGDSAFAVVIEDDTFVADDLAAWMTPAGWWPAGADLVKIECWRDDRLQVLMDPPATTFRGRAIHRLRSRHSGTGGYVICRAGAAKVLAHPTRDLPVDHLLFNFLVSPLARALASYQVTPALVVQGNEPPSPAAPSGPPRRKSLGHRINRGLAELRVLRLLPRLLTGQSRLHRITWQNRATFD